MIYTDSINDEEIFHQHDLILLEVFGLTLNPDPQLPFLILKDKTEKFVLSVRINPLEAGVMLTQSNKSIAPTTPHRFAHELLNSLEVKILQCVFVQIKGTHQYVRVYLQGHPKLNSIKLRADEVLSLVLHLGVPMFATRQYIEKAKVLSLEISDLAQNHYQNKKIRPKNQSYVI